MANMVKRQVIGAPKDVLINPDFAHEIGVQVNSTGVSNNTEGRKIIPAGTPLGGTTDALQNRKAVLSVTNASETGVNAQGILRYDVDVTDGQTNATLIVAGVIDTSKCPTIDKSVKTKLTHIIFQNGGAE